MGTQSSLGQFFSRKLAAISARRSLAPAAALALLLVGGGLLLIFFERLPIQGTSLAIDWKGLWLGLRANPPVFGNATGLRIAPWDVLLVKPLGWLPFEASWGLLTLLTLAVLVISVPRTYGRKRLWLGCLLLITSFPAVRHFADGNFEGLIIAGLLLVVYGYRTENNWVLAAGLLLATAKVQEAWVLTLVLGAYLLRTWPPRRLFGLIGGLGTVLILSLAWQGNEWVLGVGSILRQNSIVNSSLWATLLRLGWPIWAAATTWLVVAGLVVLFAWRSGPTFSRQKAAAVVAAAMLLSPYWAANSYLTVLAVGILPLVIAGNAWAVILLIVVDLSYLASHKLAYDWSASYWTAILLITFCLLAVQTWRAEKQLSAPAAIGPAVSQAGQTVT